ncbi:MAG: hypothetical protein H7831_00935 [Magnetococcus sp. WYHC-3]
MSDPHTLYQTLWDAYGPQGWWPAEGPLEMMVGAVLVQNTAWIGASRAVVHLKQAAMLDAARLRALPLETLEALIRPSGFFRLKARRLRALMELVGACDDDLSRLFDAPDTELRERLLAVSGVGAETADSILCYAASRPWFVVDTYTRRLFFRLGWTEENAAYAVLQDRVHREFPRRADLLGEFHALIVRHAKEHCRKNPHCPGCPVTWCRGGSLQE